MSTTDTLPSAFESERDVLGSCVAEGSTWWATLFRIGGDHAVDLFHEPEHRIVAAAALQAEREQSALTMAGLLDRLVGKSLDPDPRTFLHALAGHGRLKSLAELQVAISPLAEARHARKLILGSQAITQELRRGERTSTEAATELRQLSLESGVDGEVKSFGEVIDELEASKSLGVPWRSPSGIADLDRYLRGGFEPGRLYIVGARPKVGKTTALINFTLSALTEGMTVLFASLEIGESELFAKLLSAQSQVDVGSITQWLEGKLESADFDAEEWESIQEAKQELRQAPLFTLFSPQIHNGIDSVLNLAMQVMSKRPGEPLIVFVDYIQKLARSTKQSDRSAEIGAIAWQAKRFAQDHGVSVVMPAQLTRGAAEDGMPSAHHLRESGSLEQDADVVLLLNRAHLQDPEKRADVMDINVALNRVGRSTEGPSQWVQAQYLPAVQTIMDLDDDADDARVSVRADSDRDGVDGEWS